MEQGVGRDGLAVLRRLGTGPLPCYSGRVRGLLTPELTCQQVLFLLPAPLRQQLDVFNFLYSLVPESHGGTWLLPPALSLKTFSSPGWTEQDDGGQVQATALLCLLKACQLPIPTNA